MWYVSFPVIEQQLCSGWQVLEQWQKYDLKSLLLLSILLFAMAWNFKGRTLFLKISSKRLGQFTVNRASKRIFYLLSRKCSIFKCSESTCFWTAYLQNAANVTFILQRSCKQISRLHIGKEEKCTFCQELVYILYFLEGWWEKTWNNRM